MKYNYLDEWYQSLLSLLVSEDQSFNKSDRTGTGTKSLFGIQFKHNMSNGFPLLTTKKMAWKSIVTELLWFLRGDTNIKFLVDNGCHIWDGDAYKNYSNQVKMEWNDGAINELFADEFIVEDSNDGKNINYRLLTQKEFIERIKNDNEFAKKWGELGPIYGKQWRKWGTNKYDVIGIHRVDQISNLINELKTNPDSRRLMVSAWNVGELDQMVLPPCHYGFQMYTRELDYNEREKLALQNPVVKELCKLKGPLTPKGWDDYSIPTRAISLMWNQRSVDTFLGLPFNIASYGLLLEIIAEVVNMVPDQLIGNLGDVHLYNNHIEQAKEQCTRAPHPLPKLNINTEFWPTEGGSCGEGPLDASAIFGSFENDDFCRCLLEEDIQLYDYKFHPAIKAPLSN